MSDRATVLLLGNYRPSVALVRILDAAGYSVVVTREDGGLAAVSRHTSEVWAHHNDVASNEFVTELGSYLRKRDDIKIVIPVQESCVLAVARHRETLGHDKVFVTPRPDVVETCLDKIGMLGIAESEGVPSATARVVRDYGSLLESATQIGSPIIVRPASSSQPILGRKALILQDANKLASFLPQWPEGHDVLIIQRFVKGPRYNVDFAAQDGVIVRAVATKVLRTSAYDGTGIDVCGMTVEMPSDLLEYSERLANRLKYTGVGLAQFVVDRDQDDITFLELNPRYNGNHGVTEKAGLGISLLTVKLALGHREKRALNSAWRSPPCLGIW